MAVLVAVVQPPLVDLGQVLFDFSSLLAYNALDGS
jgi:hypothetical protein